MIVICHYRYRYRYPDIRKSGFSEIRISGSPDQVGFAIDKEWLWDSNGWILSPNRPICVHFHWFS